MLYRKVSSVALVLSLALAMWPGVVSAHGPIRKGIEIDHAITVGLKTSGCLCDRHWYTLGLRGKGSLTVTLKLKSCVATRLTPTCGIYAHVYRASLLEKSGYVACYAAKVKCGQSFSLRYKAPVSGAYYVLVEGVGSQVIRAVLNVRGNIYPLHCATYC